MKTTPLKMLLVSADQTLLVSLSKFLDLLGLTVRQVVDPRQAAAAAASERPDLLLLDADLLSQGGRELCRAVSGGGAREHVVTLLLIDDQIELSDVVEALKLGVEDFLAKPIIFGELLARLRAAARTLEFERRVQSYHGNDSFIGLPNSSALRQALRRALAERERAGPISCVALDLDFFNRLNYMYGKPQGDVALRNVARLLEKACGQAEIAATSGDDRFWILLPGRSESEAGQWAEQFRRTLAETQLPLGTVDETVTGSFGVATCETASTTAEEMLLHAEQALQAAKRSGRNCVVLRSSLDDETNAWTNLGAPGKLFDRTLARDVMSPCTLTLRPDDLAADAVALLRQTGQSSIAVVDGAGKLVGLVLAEDLSAGSFASGTADLVRDVMREAPQQFDEEATFADLVNFFSHDAQSLAMIVAGDVPCGIVTREGLAALSEPLSAETFAPADDFPPTSDYLVVPEESAAR